MDLLTFKPPVIAHRGASAYAPENTILAFTKAIQLGVKWIEFDVMLAACGTPIIFHDEDLYRITQTNGSVAEYPYTVLRTLDAGRWFSPMLSGERIPTLRETLEFLKATHTSANVEIKSLPGEDKKTVAHALEVILDCYSNPNDHILFSSFSVPALQVLRKISPNCLMGLLMDEWRPDWELLCDELQCVSVHVNQRTITPEKANIIKRTGRKLLCYTVNDPARAKELYSFGVDAVFSDAPDKILI